MMAAPKRNRTHPSDALHVKTRKKIQTTQLVNRLQKNALGELPEELSNSALQSMKILLDKSLPSLSSTELVGDSDKPLVITEVKRTIIDNT
tara:strand:- start:36506 stop:36778 length:273 start_codon:yes stop_codon:yes gene_type:complete